MLEAVRCRALGSLALLGALSTFNASAASVKTVFVIAMENHNWTQPIQVAGRIQQIYGNPNAPFINSVVNGSAFAVINGSVVNISEQVAYATAYHNVPPNNTGASPPAIHPSEPNYLWTEAGTNFGVFNDNDPYGPGGTNQNTSLHLSNFLTLAGKTWRSYQEDIDLTPSSSGLTNVPLPRDQWTVPLSSFSGKFAPGYFNAYNGSNQFNYAAKHNPMVFFSDTNGGDNATPSNPLSTHYAPLQQLETDLANDTVADYNWITPDQYNDMHTSLTGGFQGLTGDSANVRQGDNFLSIIVPMIMASKAYKNHGVIIIWWDETESVNGENANDFSHTLGEIIISSHAHSNVNGIPYASPVNFSHSSDLRTMQLIFGVGPFLGDAANANDLSDVFGPGAIPKKP
jgi:hypothetical protein